MIEQSRAHLRTSHLNLTHYRTEHETYLDTDIWRADLIDLGWEAMYVWFRLLTGPEYEQAGFPITKVDAALGHPRETDYEGAIETLLRSRSIVRDGGHYAFPNVIWGAPPETEGDA